MQLGPIQTQWLKDLRAYPKRQIYGQLGFKTTDQHIMCCCLGQYKLTKCEINNLNPFNDFGVIVDNGGGELNRSYRELGLLSPEGILRVPFYHEKAKDLNGSKYKTLAHMNDYGLTWLEIADYIEQNPDNVFTKSV